MAQLIRTLDQAVRHHMLVRAECGRCRKTTDFLAADLAKVFGYGRSLESLPFRCDMCGERPITITTVEEVSDERSKRYVWRPVLIGKE